MTEGIKHEDKKKSSLGDVSIYISYNSSASLSICDCG